MEDATYLEQAIRLAERGWGRVHPNPLVGAVIVRDGEVVGEGWHRVWGGPHAEVEAIREAGYRSADATLYVSLEPCAHRGKTPPCTDAIAAAGIRRVVFGAVDTTDRAGGGAELLRQRGIIVEGPLAAEAVRRQNRPFFHVQETHSTYVALKLAMSLDSRISRTATAPTQLTGPEAMAEVHRLRAGHDAILVGRGTGAADDPRLTVRGAVEPRVTPARILLDTDANLGPALRMLTGDAARVFVIVSASAPAERVRALESAGAHVLHVPPAAAGVDLRIAFQKLREHGIDTVFCEGGGRVAASLLEADLVQRLYLFIAPTFLGPDAVPAFAAGAVDARRLHVVETRTLGRDALLVLDRDRG
ncbi:MAG: bifunctional diaminohydroxyphosphoribosylaminopyrimidine deaminase/5-amino-6-(5-phosphoribosylamino)uracil reductase RibD [Longimicrobiales bacterium]